MIYTSATVKAFSALKKSLTYTKDLTKELFLFKFMQRRDFCAKQRANLKVSPPAFIDFNFIVQTVDCIIPRLKIYRYKNKHKILFNFYNFFKVREAGYTSPLSQMNYSAPNTHYHKIIIFHLSTC